MIPNIRALALTVPLACALAACSPRASDEAFGKKVREYLLAHPEVIREAVVKLNEKDAQTAAKAASAALAGYRKQLEADPRDFVANPNGSVTVVEFFDYRCGYCKIAAPEILDLIAKNPDVRFVFKELPIFGEVSDSAAKLALTAPVKARGLEVYRRWMAEKNLTEEALDRLMIQAGVDPVAARKAAEAPEIARQIEDSQVLARNLKVQGTPVFIVGDTMIPGADLPALRAAIVEAKAANAKTLG